MLRVLCSGQSCKKAVHNLPDDGPVWTKNSCLQILLDSQASLSLVSVCLLFFKITLSSVLIEDKIKYNKK